jgi:cytochrome c556
MRRGFTLVAVLGLCVLSGVGRSDSPPKSDKDKPAKDELNLPTKKQLMASKLKHTQAILEGITLGDLGKVSAAADELTLVAKGNDFLNTYKSDEYKFHVGTFRRAVDAVGKKARDKNADGVMLAYNDLTLSCVKCHQAMRDKTFDAALPTPGTKAKAGE